MGVVRLLSAKMLRFFISDRYLKQKYEVIVPHVRLVEEKNILTNYGSTRTLCYWPQTSAVGRLPVYINLHGGGFILGRPEQDDVFCRRIAHNLNCLVVNVDYALAPEHPFPTGLTQCFGVAVWLAEHAEDLSIDPFRMAVGGHSAGGNLATGVARLARERNDLKLVLQIIDYAPLDLTKRPAQKHGRADHPMIPPFIAEFFDCCYVPNASERSNSLVSPVVAGAKELTGLPPALIITAEYDLLRDEGEAYAENLRAAGVKVVHRMFNGCDHAFTHRGPKHAAEIAWQVMEDHLSMAFKS